MWGFECRESVSMTGCCGQTQVEAVMENTPGIWGIYQPAAGERRRAPPGRSTPAGLVGKEAGAACAAI